MSENSPFLSASRASLFILLLSSPTSPQFPLQCLSRHSLTLSRKE